MCIRDRYMGELDQIFSQSSNLLYIVIEFHSENNGRPQPSRSRIDLERELLALVRVAAYWSRRHVAQFHFPRENKNYTDVAKNLIESKLVNYKFKKDGVQFFITKITKFKGEAQVNIRKGKQILCYELDFDADWSADTDDDIADGTFSLRDLNESEMDFEITTVTANVATSISDKCKEILRKNLKKEIESIFANFNEDLFKFESDPNKLEEDKKKREDAVKATLQARVEKGEEKQRIFEEQKERELKMKEEFAKLPKQKKLTQKRDLGVQFRQILFETFVFKAQQAYIRTINNVCMFDARLLFLFMFNSRKASKILSANTPISPCTLR
eukprot:TRINITY_DN10457_c0_g1_i10.p1 TRINITY_DN10457_c0_g1~~TRINITY_DN10457_c0_g1_i10.p1  ORF type:complete len:328 (+),score=48.59 TRINITY_DN10457_c0_g1_i10:96-1079(+)